jgi:glutaredoxin
MFIIYYKDGCGYSEKAKKLLSLYDIPFKLIVLEDNSNSRKKLKSEYAHFTMPAIFYYRKQLDDVIKISEYDIPDSKKYGGIFIGGYNDLSNLMGKILELNKDNMREKYAEYIKLGDYIKYGEFLLIAITVIKIIKKHNKYL